MTECHGNKIKEFLAFLINGNINENYLIILKFWIIFRRIKDKMEIEEI